MKMTEMTEFVQLYMRDGTSIYVYESKMTPVRWRILKYVVSRQSTTERQIRNTLNIPRSTVNDALGWLLARGYIMRTELPLVGAQRPEYAYRPWTQL